MAIVFENRDCIEALKEFPDKFFDLAIVDPPYGIGESGAKNHSRSCLGISKDYKPFYGNDTKTPDKEYFDELFRVSNNQIIWGGNYFVSKIQKDSPCWIVWNKENGENDFADCELAWTSFTCAVRMFTFRWQGMLQGDMKNKEERIHPTQKPVALYKWLLTKFANKGDKILDTHCGSASSLVACYDLGFDAWGYEIDNYYYTKAKERLDAEMAQLRFL
jgi:site-specific DNA-methyltransferase (adenine-specific)